MAGSYHTLPFGPVSLQYSVYNTTSEKSVTKTHQMSINSKKYEILCSHWKPGSNFSFPPNKNTGRQFQYAWLSRFHGFMVITIITNSGFCINVFFLVVKAFIMQASCKDWWPVVFLQVFLPLQKLLKHCEKSSVHATATLCATQFQLMIENKALGIDVQLNTARQKLISFLPSVQSNSQSSPLRQIC